MQIKKTCRLITQRRRKGFTLIELLVVVLIIGILAAIALPMYTKTVEKSRLTEAITMTSAIEKSIQRYILENGLPATQIDGKGLVDRLDIDLSSLREKDGGSNNHPGYIGKYFWYQITCDSSYCTIYANRTNTTDQDNLESLWDIEYFIFSTEKDLQNSDYGQSKYSSGVSGNVFKACYAIEGGGKYRSRCTPLATQGFYIW